MWLWTATHVQGKSRNYVESIWSQSGQSCLPSESSRPTGCHGNAMMPINPHGQTATVWDDRGLLGSMWEALILIPQGLDYVHTELLFCRYVDTNLKYDPLVGCTFAWTISSPYLGSCPPSHQSTGLYIYYTGLLIHHGISKRTSEWITSTLFLHVKKDSCLMATLSNSSQNPHMQTLPLCLQ